MGATLLPGLCLPQQRLEATQTAGGAESYSVDSTWTPSATQLHKM